MFQEEALVKITTAPPNKGHLLGCTGYIVVSGSENTEPEVGILDDTGLVDVYTIPQACLTADTSSATIKNYQIYKKTLQNIQQEADDRQRKYIEVTNFLSRRHSVAPDEIIGIYKAILNYEKFYEEHLIRKS